MEIPAVPEPATPQKQGPKAARIARRICAAALAAALLCAAAEGLYRLAWKSGRLFLQSERGNFFALYNVGDSTAFGVPYECNITPAELAAWQFGGKIDGRRIRIFKIAYPGETIYPQAAALERALRHRNRANPGAVFIYSANNDLYDNSLITPLEKAKNSLREHSWLLADLFYLLERHGIIPSPRSTSLYEHYMERAVQVSLKNGLTPILSTAVSNICGIDPDLPRNASRDDLSDETFLRAEDLEKHARPRQALALYRQLEKTKPQLLPLLLYRQAECLKALRDYAGAGAAYEQALLASSGEIFRRCSEGRNHFIRELARRYGLPLAAPDKLFRARAPHGLLDSSMFMDGHHPNLDGHILLGKSYAEALSRATGTPVTRRFSGTEQLKKEFAISTRNELDAFMMSGNWLLAASVDHAAPRLRVEMARGHFRRALKLQPNNCQARLALALTDTALSGDLLSAHDAREMLERNYSFRIDQSRAYPPKDVLAVLRRHGLAQKALEEIRRLCAAEGS